MNGVFREVLLIGSIEFLSDKSKDQLLSEAKFGNVKSFEIIMNEYMEVLYNYILSNISNIEDANDILQESMLAIWQGVNRFKGNSSFKTWTIGITRRKIADFYRKYYNRNHFEIIEYEEMENVISAQDEINNAINKIDIEKSISTLKSSDRELLFLIFKARLTYGEIEVITGIPKGTIKSRIYSMKSKLRPLLSEGGSSN